MRGGGDEEASTILTSGCSDVTGEASHVRAFLTIFLAIEDKIRRKENRGENPVFSRNSFSLFGRERGKVYGLGELNMRKRQKRENPLKT